jgi:phosphoadenosine phosphosulfate reductase
VSEHLPSTDALVPIPADLETLHPLEVLRWTFETFGASRVAATVSFEDAVLPHLVHLADPTAEVVLLDTQYLFAETQWFVTELQVRFGLPVRVVRPVDGVEPDNRWQHDVEGCCAVRKVEPLDRALAGRAAWVTGIRRVDGPTRADAPVASYDPVRNLVKVNPLANWTDEDLASWVAEHDLPVNPLVERGFPSIGCWPCTRPVAPGEDRRAGRWAGSAKTECGLHQ